MEGTEAGIGVNRGQKDRKTGEVNLFQIASVRYSTDFNRWKSIQLERFSSSGRSSAWLERLLWEQEVARSNRVAPTLWNQRFTVGYGQTFLDVLSSLWCRKLDSPAASTKVSQSRA